jgi:iron complex transport system permease protein
MSPAKLVIVLLALLAVAGCCLLFSLLQGSVPVSLSSLWNADMVLQHQIIRELRFPRAASAFVVGGSLAVSGALMQVLLRNPLADPYILGVSGGAAFGALSALSLGLAGIWLHSLAFGGALFSTLIVFVLAHGKGSWNATRLLLTGVVLAAGWGALISLLLSLSPNTHLRGMLFWLMGDFSGAQLPTWSAVALLIGLLISLSMSRGLNLMVSGDTQAAALGVNVVSIRRWVYLTASLLTASAVTLAGTIGFVGLIVPHWLRLMGIRDHRLLLPASLLLGGSVLMLADTLARSILAPTQLPVGVLTALIGVPVFLFLLYRNRSLHSSFNND